MIVQGPIAWLGVDTLDGRRVDALTVFDYRLPLPVLDSGVNIGRLSVVEFRADRSVWAKGEIDWPEYVDGWIPVGLDMECMSVGFDPSAPENPDELLSWWDRSDAVEVISGALLGVTIGGHPSWPDAHLAKVGP